MDGASMNGGNAETSHENSNLEGVDGGAAILMAETQDSSSNKMQPTSGDNADAQEVNGDLKGTIRKSDMPSPRRKLKKYKSNSAGIIESDSMETLVIRERKRKLSDAFDDASSEDSTGEFNGFDSQGLELQPGSDVLSKLIGSIRYFSYLFSTSILHLSYNSNMILLYLC